MLDQVKAIQRNSEYEVVVMKPSLLRDKTKSYEVDGIKVHLFTTLQTPSYLFNGIFNGYNGSSFVKAVKELGMDLSRVRFVHTHTGPFAVYGLALRKVAPHIKVFVQHHDPDPFTIMNGRLAKWSPNAYYRAKNSCKLFNAVDLHICISRFVRDALLSFPSPRNGEKYQPYISAVKNVRRCLPIECSDIYILYNGVDTTLFNPLLSDPKRYGAKNDIFRIGSIGNMIDWKGHIDLVKALDILVNKGYTNIRLSLVGSGVERHAIETYLQRHNLERYVEWPKEVSHDKLPSYYHSLDLFVLPSYFEGFGCVFTEAFACGVPFIGCYDQGAAECIAPKEKDKWLVEPKSPQQIAERIERYYCERDEQHLCQPYDINILISNFIKHIETL